MKSSLPRILVKLLKIGGITVGSLIAIMFLLPYLFPGFVSDRIRHWARHSVRTDLSFSKARLSFFRHFPALTLTLHDVKLQGSEPFGRESLIEADEISLGVDIRSVFSEVTINKIFLTNAFINIQSDSVGRVNYNVYISEKSRPKNPSDSSSASLRIEKILIEKSKLVYNDRSLPLLINARGVEYEGDGDLSQAVFDLNTHMQIASMDLYYDRMAWFVNKKINADLVTKINTHSLAFLFEKNALMINRLPVVFTGRFEFLKEGYDMDFQMKARNAALHDVLTAMPPETLDWLSKTDVKGVGDIDASLVGKYDANAHLMPDMKLDMKIHDGGIANAGAPSPLQNVVLNVRTRIPGLNPDSLSADVDSLYFSIGKDYFMGRLQLKGMKEPWISASIRSDLDLEKWDKAVGLAPYDLKGRLQCKLDAEGKYATKIVRTPGLRKDKIDTVITSIPRFNLQAGLSNGYFKYASLPEGISEIGFKIDASCPDNDYKHIRMDMRDLNAKVLSNYIKGNLKVDNANGLNVDGSLETVFHLADAKKVYPLDSMEVAGDLAVHIKTKGRYVAEKKQFPVTVADLRLGNGRLQTKYYPRPLEDIQVSARIVNNSGDMKGLSVALTPLSFKFEGQPFTVKADLQNFDNLKYIIVSRGLLDIGRIYQVFAVKGYDVKGMVEADLSLKGRQSDAVAGRYDLLFNSGTLKVRDLQVSSELFPQPFYIQKGLFRFEQDKMWFDEFKARYGKTEATLQGWLSNVIGYMSDKHSPLKGNFTLSSDYFHADEFMAFAPPASGAKAAGPAGEARVADFSGLSGEKKISASGGETGVLMVPTDLAVSFGADVKRVSYNGLDIQDLTGGMSIDSGRLKLDTTRFTMIGTKVEMDAWYKSLSPKKAEFDYHIKAKDFDVQRAYREVKLFRDMATSASKAQGVISIDYQLAGRLDGSMHPVYPSLKGGGVLSLSKVKVKGLKLFGAVSQETNKDVNDPDLSKVDIKTTINNNLITIARTRMKVSVFRLRTEGQASFDGKLNLKFRVGLPPFGLIGIPLTITGTQDNPKVKAGRGKKGDQLEETEDKDEEEAAGKEN